MIVLNILLTMENQLKELEQHSHTQGLALQEVLELSDEILKDCQLKKGKKAKFIKHMDRLSMVSQDMIKIGFGLEEVEDEALIVATAALLKNLGKLGEHQETLQRGVEILSKLKHYKAVVVRWMLQIAALKSSKKEHQECYEIAQKAFQLCQQIVGEYIDNNDGSEQNRSELLFAQKILEIAREKTKDEIIWLINEKCIAEEILTQLRKSADENLYIPYYPSQDFHIADYMSLEECPRGWETSKQSLKSVVTYLSICCFTMATEKYYQKDFSQKFNHLKSLKLALCSFDINCSYVSFLLKILNQHFGRRMQPIQEQHSETAQRFEMRRAMPRDTKEVNMKFIQLAE